MNALASRARTILAAAATLEERMARCETECAASDAIAQSRLRRWQAIVAGGNDERFLRRLAIDGLTSRTAAALLREEVPAITTGRPHVARLLRRAMAAADQDSTMVGDRMTEVLELPTPVGAVVRSMVIAAAESLRREGPRSIRLLSDSAIDDLSRCVGERLSVLARGVSARDITPPSMGPLEFLGRFPVLARLLAETAAGFIDWITRMLHDFEANAAALSRWHPIGDQRGVIQGIDLECVPHSYDQCCAVLRLAGGGSLLYRSGPSAAFVAFQRLLRWLNERGMRPPLLSLEVCAGTECCWMEYVQDEGPSSANDVRLVFERVGMLACLIRLLNGPFYRYLGPTAVVGTQPILYGFDLEWDWGGQGNTPADCAAPPLPWLHPGASIRDRTGQLHAVEGYRGDVERGFARAYRFLAQHSRELLAPGGPVEAFRTVRCVVRLRDTKDYEALRDGALRARCLRNGIDRSIELEALWTHGLAAGPSFYGLIRSEKRRLEQHRIPVFFADADDVAIYDSAGESAVVHGRRSAFAQIALRFGRLSSKHLREEVWRLRFCLKPPDSMRSHSSGATTHRAGADGSFAELARSTAVRIGDELRNAMVVEASDRDPVWVAATQSGSLVRFALRPMDVRFHDGIAGIGLFYAALFAVSGRRADWELAMRCVRAIARASARGNGRLLEETIGLNGLRGCAGLVYAVSRIGRLLGSDEAIQLARGLARKLERQSISAKGGDYCVVLGLAGTVLALLALYEQTAEPQLVELAAEFGRLLIDGREVDPHTGLRVWPTLASPGGRRVMGTGFAHGSSGVCVALGALYRRYRADALLEAIQEAREFENRLFSDDQRNWYDESPPSESALGNRMLMRAWCHGATGIVLSRVALGDLPGMAFNGQEIDLAEPRRGERQELDQLCCGRLGILELLVAAGVKFGNLGYVTRAEQIARAIIEEANALGGFAPLRDPRVFAPGLFHGRAGIGYQMLRIAYPGMLPSVLLVE